MIVAFVANPIGMTYGPIHIKSKRDQKVDIGDDVNDEMEGKDFESGGEKVGLPEDINRLSLSTQKETWDPRFIALNGEELVKALGSIGFGIACWMAARAGVI